MLCFVMGGRVTEHPLPVPLATCVVDKNTVCPRFVLQRNFTLQPPTMWPDTV